MTNRSLSALALADRLEAAAATIESAPLAVLPFSPFAVDLERFAIEAFNRALGNSDPARLDTRAVEMLLRGVVIGTYAEAAEHIAPLSADLAAQIEEDGIELLTEALCDGMSPPPDALAAAEG